MHDLQRCAYRRNVRTQGDGGDAELADCLFLQRATGLYDSARCAVGRDACEACCKHDPPSFDGLNPVVASLLYHLSGTILEDQPAPECSPRRARALQRWAEAQLADSRVRPIRTPSCDVIICCHEDSEAADHALRSVLEQQGAIAIIHLVDDGGGASRLLERYAGSWNVVVHRNATRRGAFATLHDLLPVLHTEFVAIQDPATVSLPTRIRQAVTRLESTGAEILAAPMQTQAGTFEPRLPGLCYERCLPAETLVMRRASLIDMGGFAERPLADDADAEFIYRAGCEGRTFAFAEAPAVAAQEAWRPGALGPAPHYEVRGGTLAHHARGFSLSSIACDVVLPFHGHIDYVNEALPSVLEQQGAEAIVHLVDDATPGGAESLLRRWGSHRQVRTYRNKHNIGQFATFNNVFPFIETGLVAVQDADDISLPSRLQRAGNSLRLADTDIFGGQTEWFSTTARNGSVNGSHDATDGALHAIDPPRIGLSRYPREDENGYFIQNPTAVMRASAFEALRGFCDYGDLDRNKCGVDTELYVRAFYAGMRFFVSRAVVLKYRSHPHSATQNPRTGWGSPARSWTEAENARRFRMFQSGVFDPRVFGGLTKHRGLTHRVSL